ncbi:MAG: fibronectin type III domain-containing protein [Melioribacteraceae bacterium]|nr:fibronectin type III domain-containing protein [Melioribacteraceae bacterium]MCF8354564.1 fibronectin type III domain-containing protein [Melioribacteraceae bacterium]MCF8394496.1 fibronectin type III domain-containing protein [Melioribacteraceae bacterium]MCF8420094.1 fibronectin type III domain-containing protein [Melioribacteraceae bacterium]
MKKLLGCLTILFSVSLLFIGCVQSSAENPNAVPTITITSPVEGDTVQIGKNIIKVSASDYAGGQGISHYEVFVNDEFQERFDQGDTLFMTISESLIGNRISYYVIVYNLEGGMKISSVINNLYVSNLPAAPSNLTLSIFNSNQVLLQWEDNAINETNYEVWRSKGNNGSYGGTYYKRLPQDATNTTDIGLSEFVDYFYKVRAVNENGASEFSNELNTGGASGSDIPTNLIASAIGASRVILTWNDNSDNENGYVIERLNYSAGDEEFKQVGVVAPNSVEYLDEGLLSRNLYGYRVGALLTTTIAYSNTTEVETGSQDVAAPSNLVADFDFESRAIKITWSDNTDQEYGTKIERKLASDTRYSEIGSTDNDISIFYDQNFQAEVVYYYRARHVTSEGTYTNYSNIDTARAPLVAPLAPSNLLINETGTNRFLLSWTDNSNDEDGFEIWRKVSSASTFELFKTTARNVDDITISDVSRDSIFYFSVRAFKGTLYSDFTNEVVTPLLKPTNFTAVPDTSGNVKVYLTWTDNSTLETRYEIERRISGTSSFTRIAVVGENIETYTDQTSGLYRGTSYEYRLRASNDEVDSEYSAIVPVTIPY